MSACEAPTPTPKSAAPEDKVRKDLVQVFFGLVLGQIAVYVASLIEIWQPTSLSYWVAWSHIILTFFLTTTSWFGWQMSVRKTRLDEEASVFQGGFVLSLLDILLVTLYFLLVHQAEVKGVAAFPPKDRPEILPPSAAAETWIILIVFLIYVVWDTLSYINKEKEYGPWPSIVCAVLSALALLPMAAVTTSHLICVLVIDMYLLGLVFLFRALKRLQKWNNAHRPEQTTLQLRAAPTHIKAWVFGCGGVSAVIYLISVVPLARR
jgi:hypothetical protein